MERLSALNIKDKKIIIALATFGSFDTEFWIEGKSDIDVFVLVERKAELSFEFKLEDELIPLLQQFFSYDNIHLTIIYKNEFESPLAMEYLESKNKLIIDAMKEMDFRLYVNKHKRSNEWLEALIKRDNEALRREKNDGFYKYKKERLESKFIVAKDILALMQGGMKEYSKTNSVFLRRAILGYFEDFSEYIIDMCETYLVITDNYIDGCSSTDLIKRARIYGFLDDTLCEFLTNIIRLRNRYTHDYYKRDRVEEDIIRCCFSEMMYLQIFLEVTDLEIHLKTEKI